MRLQLKLIINFNSSNWDQLMWSIKIIKEILRVTVKKMNMLFTSWYCCVSTSDDGSARDDGKEQVDYGNL